MSIKFPDAESAVDRIRQFAQDEFRDVSIMAELLAFQANTIAALADFLVSEARKFELTNKTITFAELKAAAAKLKEYAQTLAPAAPEANR
jgi:uncharacterized coiled-coil protein SlyX